MRHTVGQAARLTGVSASTVREWERQGLVTCWRSPSGYRYFDEDQLARLRLISRLRKVDRLNAAGIKLRLSKLGGDNEPSPNRSAARSSPGAVLRRHRQKAGLSLARASEMAGVSLSFLSALERDQSGASPSTFRKIAQVYGATASSLFRNAQADLIQYKNPTRRARVDQEGISSHQLVDGHTLMDGAILELAPGAASGSDYSHEGEELLLVLSGALEIVIDGDETYTLSAEDSIYFPSTLPHRYSNPGSGVARVIWVCTPPTY